MKTIERLFVLSAVLCLPMTGLGGDAVYKAIDDSGNVTYSAEPPTDAAIVESVEIPPGPSEEATWEALERARDTEEAADRRYDAKMERRQQEADARAKAQEEARTAEQARRAAESADDPDAESPDYLWYGRDWLRPYPPHPPLPPRPPHPPLPPHSPLRGAP
jgi:hypothetical protein